MYYFVIKAFLDNELIW